MKVYSTSNFSCLKLLHKAHPFQGSDIYWKGLLLACIIFYDLIWFNTFLLSKLSPKSLTSTLKAALLCVYHVVPWRMKNAELENIFQDGTHSGSVWSVRFTEGFGCVNVRLVSISHPATPGKCSVLNSSQKQQFIPTFCPWFITQQHVNLTKTQLLKIIFIRQCWQRLSGNV